MPCLAPHYDNICVGGNKVHETPLTVGGLIDSAITHGDYVSKTVAAGNIARIGYVIFIHEMNNFIATPEPTGE